MTVFYFTATGNCLYVAKQIGGTLYSIPQLMKEKKYKFKDDVIGIVYPCYAFGIPDIVKKFLKRVKWEAEYSFAITTYGNISAAALLTMEQFASKCGIQFDYMNELLMVDNFLPGYKMEDQIKKIPTKQIEKNMKQIANDIEKRRIFKPNPNTLKKAMSFTMGKADRFFINRNFDRRFIVNNRCTSCKICAKVCPKRNIIVYARPDFQHNCECCYACIHMCPENAIHLKSQRSRVRFRNENVTLKEIITANNQQ